MRYILFLCLGWLVMAPCAVARPALADDLVALEYFWDDDPGLGKATSLTITRAAAFDGTLNVPTSATLTQGIHFLGVRLRTANGQWSPTLTSPVYIHTLANSGDPTTLTAVEVFFNDDLGFGRNIVQRINSKGSDTPISFSLTVPATLPVGVHLMGLRTQTERGQWSGVQLAPITIFSSQSTATITRVELFLDPTTAYGAGTALTFSPTNAQEVTVDDRVTLGIRTPGRYTFQFRARDSNGRWSPNYAVPVDVTLVLATEDLSGQVRIYPNPSTGLFTVELDNPLTKKGPITLDIVDAQGRTVYQKTLGTLPANHREQIDLSAQPMGQYILRIAGDSIQQSGKVIKQ